MKIVKLLIVMVVVVVGAGFAVLNADPVHFNFYFGARDLPLSLILVTTLCAGVLTGVLFGLLLTIGVKRENRELRRKVRLAEQEVTNLRSIPIKDR